MKKVDQVKIYWEEFPENIDQFKNVLNPAKFQKPSKVLNSTEVMVTPKPWLQKQVVSTKSESEKVKPRNVNVDKLNNMALDTSKSFERQAVNTSKNSQRMARINDLDPEDKQKIANLIRELAKFGNEKELAIKQLSHVKQDFNNLQKQLQSEKEFAVKEYDSLKQQLLEYEILVEEMKHQSNLSNPEPVNKIDVASVDGKSEASLIDNFSDLFLEQEKKFQQQQNILQEQIEQLQKLQESVLRNQTLNRTPRKEIPKNQESSCPNTKKLESYLLSSSQKKNLQNEEGIGADEPSISMSSQSIKHCNNVSTNKTAVDMEVQTESSKVFDATQIVVEDSYKNHQKITGPICQVESNHSRTALKQHEVHHKTLPRKINSIKRTSCTRNNPSKSVGFSTKSWLSTFSDEEEVVNMPEAALSPVLRKHFKPSSMIELVEGIQPRSTSTSVDQYSLKRSTSSKGPTLREGRSTTLRGPTLREGRSTSLRGPTLREGRSTTGVGSRPVSTRTESVYRSRVASETQNPKQVKHHNEEIMERDLLNEVFFM